MEDTKEDFKTILNKRISDLKTETQTKKETKEWEKNKVTRMSRVLKKYFESEEMKLIKELLELTESKINIFSVFLDERSIILSIKSDLSFEYNDISSGTHINKNKVPNITEVAEIINKHRPNWEVEDVIKAIREGATKL